MEHAVRTVWATLGIFACAEYAQASTATPGSVNVSDFETLPVWTVADRCSSNEANKVLVVLHGYGATRPQIHSQIKHYAARHCNAMVFPEGPKLLTRGRRAWWLPSKSSPGRSNARVQQARDRLTAMIRNLMYRWRLSSTQVVLVGFSQGATLAAHVTLGSEFDLGGVVLFAGRFHTLNKASDFVAPATTRAVLAHGLHDRIASYRGAVLFRSRLESAGVAVQWLAYDGGHRPPPAVDQDLHRAITAVLNADHLSAQGAVHRG